MNYQVIILFIVYAVFLVSLGYFRPESKKSKFLIRKSVHLVTGLLIFFLTFQISRQALLTLFIAGTIFSFLSYFIKKVNYIHVTGESSWGTLFYPLGILLSFLILYNMPLYYFQISLLFLAISDTIANIGGYLVARNPQFSILNEKKTPIGILGFALTAFPIAFAFLPGSLGTIMYVLLLVLFAIHFEIISYKGSDNFAIPVGTALFFYLTHGEKFSMLWLITVILTLSLVSIFLYKTGTLTKSGSIAAHFLGIYIFGILGLEWGIPIAFFFVSSVIFTRIKGLVTQKFDHAGKRNIWQVMANILAGIFFSIFFLINPELIFIYLFITSVAAVTADTWASEIGPVFQQKCFSLAKWRKADAGVSGGVSVAGTLAAFSGSFLLSLVAWIGFFPMMDMQHILIIAIAGFLASFVDSILGAFLEPYLEKLNFFKNSAEAISANDVVNLLASFSAPLFYIIIRHFLI